jgi:serine/threonine-protein kinase HipA
MKRAKVYVNAILAGEIQEIEKGKKYRYTYLEDYSGPSVSLEMPISQKIYDYDRFPNHCSCWVTFSKFSRS